MQDDSRIIHRTTDEVRAGRTQTGVRWVLAISLLAAILALSAIWIFGAATQGDSAEADIASRHAEAQERGVTDSIVTPGNPELPAAD